MDALPRQPFSGPGAALRQDSALKHTTGEARFADDMPMPPGLLHAALVLSPVAHGRLSADEAWTLSRLDENWQIAQWGEDEEAAEMTRTKAASFLSAAQLYAVSR